jgi:hypothetical protein
VVTIERDRSGSFIAKHTEDSDQQKNYVLGAALTLATFIARLQISALFKSRAQKRCLQLAASQVSPTPDQQLIPDLVRSFALRNGGRLRGPKLVCMKQTAEMRLGRDQPFFPIRASQISGTKDAGFVWHAIGNMRQIITLQIIDKYVAGRGQFEARVAGVVPVAKAQ